MNEEKKYILAIDQSTSATKILLFNAKAELVNRVSIPHRQFYPQPGFVEHDPREIFSNTLKGMGEVIEKTGCREKEIACIAITNQRETAMIWEKNSGEPIGMAAVWQCQRGVEYCERLRKDHKADLIMERTGLIIDPYFSASKLQWIMDHVKGARGKMDRGELLAGTMDSWLVWNLSGKKAHVTDFSNASRTMLLNLKEMEWDQDMIDLFTLTRNMLPELVFSDQIAAYTEPGVIFKSPVPIAGLMGDSHAALFGQNCFERGMAKATYGTGSSIMMNIGKEALDPPDGLVCSVGWGRNKAIEYVFEGNIHCTGDTINWLVNDLKLLASPEETEELAFSVSGSGGVYLVPAFVGLGAPYWDNKARALICGMDRGTGRAHIARAALESIAYQVKDLVDLMVLESGIDLKELRVDGGPTRNNFLMQFQADILGRSIVRTRIEEISALGAVFMAGLASGIWSSLEEITELRLADKQFPPGMESETVNALYSGWKKAVKCTQQIYK
ncbi:MAG: glycerol kinase GlpK, partial [Bacteroidales bacterium]